MAKVQKLVQNKIKDFLSPHKKPKRDWGSEKKKFPEKHFTFRCNFTDRQCETVSRKIRKIIRKFTPDYNISFCWKSITLDSLILPRLKCKQEPMQCANIVYSFKCPGCSDEYVGQTRRSLHTRSLEHRRTDDSNVCGHIRTCDDYLILVSCSQLDSRDSQRKFITLNSLSF